VKTALAWLGAGCLALAIGYGTAMMLWLFVIGQAVRG